MKMKQAFRVTGEQAGKSWTKFSLTVCAENKEEAIKTASLLVEFVPDNCSAVAVTVYGSESKLTANNYPYGRLKTTAYFGVEYKKGKGFRTTFQTINPKTGVLNKVKNSTYCPVILPMVNEETKHINYCGYLDFNGTHSINKGLRFMSCFFDLFTPEQIKDIASYVFGMVKVNIKAQAIYCGSDVKELLPHYDSFFKNIAEMVKTGENLFSNCLLDVEKIHALKVEGYQPFVTR